VRQWAFERARREETGAEAEEEFDRSDHTDATIGYEARHMDNALRGSMDAAECTSSSV